MSADDTPTLPVHGESRRHAAVSADPGSLDCGTVLCSRYVLDEVIGCGGTSLVFRAHDLHRVLSANGAANPIAIKVIRPELRGDRHALGSLQREFRQMERLSHPNIVRVFDLCRDGDIWFITMQLIVGQTLKAWSAASDESTTALRVIGGCCAALEHAHSMGILHGDLKPSNVIIAEHGKANLIDFGSVPEPGSSFPAIEPCYNSATPAFSSPQILMGREAEERDDVFGIACLSYVLLSGGGHPFGGRPAVEDDRIISAPANAQGIDAEMFKVIERGLSGERGRRHASVREFRLELAAASNRTHAPIAVDGNHAGNQPTALVPWAAPVNVGRDRGWRATFRAPLLALGVAACAIALYLRYDTTGTAGNTAAPAAPIPAAMAETTPALPALPQPLAAARPRSARNDVVSFATTMVQASAAQPVIAIALRRSGQTASRGEVRWRVTTLGAAVAPGYIGLSSGLARFNEGQTARTLFIPLVNDPSSPPRGPRMLSVALEIVAGGSALGSPASTTVEID